MPKSHEDGITAATAMAAEYGLAWKRCARSPAGTCKRLTRTSTRSDPATSASICPHRNTLRAKASTALGPKPSVRRPALSPPRAPLARVAGAATCPLHERWG
jgi:hypothetical protein